MRCHHFCHYKRHNNIVICICSYQFKYRIDNGENISDSVETSLKPDSVSLKKASIPNRRVNSKSNMYAAKEMQRMAFSIRVISSSLNMFIE